MGMNDHHAGAVPGHLNRALQYQGRAQQGKGIHHQHGGGQGTQPIAHRSGRLGRDIGTQGGDEQPVRVHAIWRARHQGDAILACDDSEFRHIGRFDHADTVDPVSEGFPHHCDTENVARLQFVETGEHQCFDQTPVTGDDRMRIGAADREGV